MKLLLTGGSGTIGRQILGQIPNSISECKIFNISYDSQVSTETKHYVNIKADLRQSLEGILPQERFDAVIHCAAFIPLSGISPENVLQEILSTNIYGTFNLFSTLNLQENAHIIYLSSAAVYREKEGLKGFREEDPTGPAHIGTFYGDSKLICEWYLSRFCKEKGVRLTIVRPSYVYGRGMDKKKIIPRLLREASENRVLSIKLPVDEECDYIHAHDVATGVMRILESGIEDIFNLGSGTGVSLLELAEMCIEVAGKGKLPCNIHSSGSSKKRVRQLIDITKAKRLLNWQPEVKFRDGLSDLLVWINEKGQKCLK